MDQQDHPVWTPPPVPGSPALSAPETTSASPQARRSRIGTGVAVAAIGIGALGIVGTAYAASASNSPTPSPGTSRPANGYAPAQPGPNGAQGQPGSGPMMGGDRDGGRRGMHGGPGMGLGMGALHGTFVTEKQGGGYQTVDVQRGTVTKVSSTSITVTSTDGFTATYDVTADTLVNAQRDGIGSIKVGDEVGVTGIENAGSTTAVEIVDRTQLKDARQKWAPGQPDGGAAASPAPSSTSTA